MLSQKQAMQQPLLSQEDELSLFHAWRNGKDHRARDRLIVAHMRLCYSVAHNYDSNEEHARDLAQEGVFGLIKALEKYDPEKGTRFGTYARWWVRAEIADRAAIVGTVVDMSSRRYLEARGGGFENEALSWAARQAARGEVPLDSPVGTDGEATLVDLLPDTRPDPEAVALGANRLDVFRERVDDALSKSMSAREALVLRRRALAEDPETLEAIADDLHVSRERVRQIEVSALTKLRDHLVGHEFPDGLFQHED